MKSSPIQSGVPTPSMHSTRWEAHSKAHLSQQEAATKPPIKLLKSLRMTLTKPILSPKNNYPPPVLLSLPQLLTIPKLTKPRILVRVTKPLELQVSCSKVYHSKTPSTLTQCCYTTVLSCVTRPNNLDSVWPI